MKISIITVCYNAEKTIADAMASVASQQGLGIGDQGSGIGGLAIEHIVVDGGSTDGTVDVIGKFEAERIPLPHSTTATPNYDFRWVSEKDRGMYDALNKGMRMATGDVIGILNADDVFADENTLARIASVFREQGTGNGEQINGCYADIRFVKELGGPTVRYCSGRWFSPWMFRFGVQTAHPSTFFRRECFEKWGEYSLDYGMYGDFELLCRFMWKNRAKMRYVPICTTVMRYGGASTDGWRTNLRINQSDLRALRANGCRSCLPLLYLKYVFKVWGFVFRRKS